MSTVSPVKELSFFPYLFRNKQNMRLLLIAFAANVVLFFIFKMLCPDGYFISDSNSYVLAASKSQEVFYRPYGYSKFLQLVQSFSQSVNFLIWVQFLMLFLAGQFAFFSVDYLYQFKNTVIRRISWILVTFNPILFFLANFVLSDGIFTALSAIYITLLLWVVKRPNWWVIVLQAIVLYWAFQIRYTALFYPVLTIFAFLLSAKSNLFTKAIGMAISVLLVFASYRHIKSQVNEVTGVDVFSGFSGWQMANNVMGLYPYINTSDDDFETPEVKLLDSVTRMYVDSISPEYKAQIRDQKLTSGFLWDTKSPLKLFLFHYMQTYRQPYFISWYQVSETYDEFGKTIIKKHPGAFLTHFILPNTQLYFLPIPEGMANDKDKQMDLPEGTVEWFGLKSGKIKNPLVDAQPYVSGYATFMNCIIGLLNLILPIIYLLKRKQLSSETQENDTKSVIFWWLMVGCNMAFSIFAALIVLRYQCLWLVIGFGFPLIMLDRLLTIRKTQS